MRIKRFLCAMLTLCCLFLPLLETKAEAFSEMFTHPEIGEVMTVSVFDNAANFTIYGFTYYQTIQPEQSYRGLTTHSNQIFEKKHIAIQDALSTFFESIEGKMPEYPAPELFEYGGYAKDWQKALDELPLKKRIDALLLLNGFKGPEGYIALKKIKGFEGIDIATLQNEYVDYRVLLENKYHPYRVLSFYIENKEWFDCFIERYAFLMIDEEWKLIGITKEYNDEYNQRADYIHGIAGSMPQVIEHSTTELLNGVSLGMTPDEVAEIEGISADESRIDIADVSIFRIPANLTYQFENNALARVQYVFNNQQAFYSAFVSLYMRYIDPVTIASNGDMTWSLNNLQITLRYDDEHPSLCFESNP